LAKFHRAAGCPVQKGDDAGLRENVPLRNESN